MNQDSFRSLLSESSTSVTSATTRGSLLPPKKPTHPDANSTQKSAEDKEAFKPRKLNSKFRDRAAERREGVNDYAEIEGILHDFEKRNAGVDRAAIDEQRKYLGGDADHSILVKGLDFALLEQNKARATAEEDAGAEAALEAALSGNPLPTTTSGPSSDAQTATPSTSTAKPRRTREERIADLKRRRDAAKNGSSISLASSTEDVEKLEKAKKMGKFRPIGVPPPAAPTKEDGPEKRKKKKRKIAVGPPESAVTGEHKKAASSLAVSAPAHTLERPPPPAQTPLPSDPKPASTSRSVSPLLPLSVAQPPLANPHSKNRSIAAGATDDSDEDIFADAGSYKGFTSDRSSDSDTPSDLGGDDREKQKKLPNQQSRGERNLDAKIVGGDAPQIGRWFGDDPDLTSLIAPPTVEPPKHDQATRGVSNKRQRPRSPPAQMSVSPLGTGREDGEEAESAILTRLQPLSSSLSITEILEVDQQAEAEEKRKARKAKRKAAAGEGAGTGEPVEKAPKKKLDRNQKLQRDYQQYTSYVEKNSKGETSK